MQAFSSSTLSLEVTKTFLGKGTGTLFVLHSAGARQIHQCSAFPEEQEALFPPNTEFQVLAESHPLCAKAFSVLFDFMVCVVGYLPHLYLAKLLFLENDKCDNICVGEFCFGH